MWYLLHRLEVLGLIEHRDSPQGRFTVWRACNSLRRRLILCGEYGDPKSREYRWERRSLQLSKREVAKRAAELERLGFKRDS